jgi:hypothetical protein
MNANLAPASKADFLRRAAFAYQKVTGQTMTVCALAALFNFIAQIALRRELLPGEFGTFNTALGAIGLMTVPLLAVNQAFTLYLSIPHDAAQSAHLDSLRSATLLVTETFAWIWGVISLVLIFFVLQLLDLPRFSLQLFSLLNVLLALGGILSFAISQSEKRLGYWAALLLAATATRAIVSAGLGAQEPWADSGLAAILLAGFITLVPALRARETDTAARLTALRAVWNRDFLLYAGATFSVLLALFLFSSADRIVGQSWFGVATNTNMQFVDWAKFDAYQTAGLLGRALLWGTQPLLWILFAQRSQLAKTSATSLTFFWIHLGSLVLGAILLGLLAQPLSHLFCGANFQLTALFVPTLAAVMVPLGLLQALGIFALASRRYPECFVLGACSVGYTLLLYIAGRQPQIMPAYMFGGALVSLTVVLFVGVVRWGRKQP